MAADELNLSQQGTLPPELYAQQQALNRQQQMAQLLMQQGQQQPQGQMVSGRYVPTSFFQNLQPVANMLTGAYLAKQGDTKAAELAKQLREGRTSAEEKIINKMVGTPAQATELAGPYTNQMPMPVAVQPAVAPDLPGALREIRTNPYGAGKEYTPTILKQMMPEDTSDYKNYLKVKAEGFPGTFNQYQDMEANRKRPISTTNVINQMGKSIAERVGPIMEKEQEKTIAANKIYDSASNLTRVLDTNKIFAGIGANVKLGIAQLANTAGFGGNTLEEKIANTRTGIQSLAQLTLQGRKEMKGEGAIQVQESGLAERAISGDINFTPTELKILANAAQRSAKYTQDQYDRKLKYMAADKETAGLVPYFEVPPMSPIDGGWRVKDNK